MTEVYRQSPWLLPVHYISKYGLKNHWDMHLLESLNFPPMTTEKKLFEKSVTNLKTVFNKVQDRDLKLMDLLISNVTDFLNQFCPLTYSNKLTQVPAPPIHAYVEQCVLALQQMTGSSMAETRKYRSGYQCKVQITSLHIKLQNLIKAT